MLRRLVGVIGRLSQVFGRNRGVIRRPFAVAGLGEMRCLLLMLTGDVVVVHRYLTMVLCGFGHLEFPPVKSSPCAAGRSPLKAKNARLLNGDLPSVGSHRCRMAPNVVEVAKLML